MAICSVLNPDLDCHHWIVKKKVSSPVRQHYPTLINYILYIFSYSNALNCFIGLETYLGNKVHSQSRKPSRQLRDLDLILCLWSWCRNCKYIPVRHSRLGKKSWLPPLHNWTVYKSLCNWALVADLWNVHYFSISNSNKIMLIRKMFSLHYFNTQNCSSLSRTKKQTGIYFIFMYMFTHTSRDYFY